MIQELSTKIEILEVLQIKELKVYQGFLGILENHSTVLLPDIDKPEVLSEMMAAKKKMMDEVNVIEAELSPIRKEVAISFSSGSMDFLTSEKIEKIKSMDIQIIESISQISKVEQALTQKIQNKMADISSRLNEIGNKKKIKRQYGGSQSNYVSKKENKGSGSLYLDFSG